GAELNVGGGLVCGDDNVLVGRQEQITEVAAGLTVNRHGDRVGSVRVEAHDVLAVELEAPDVEDVLQVEIADDAGFDVQQSARGSRVRVRMDRPEGDGVAIRIQVDADVGRDVLFLAVDDNAQVGVEVY